LVFFVFMNSLPVVRAPVASALQFQRRQRAHVTEVDERTVTYILALVLVVLRCAVATNGSFTEVESRRPRLALGWVTARGDRTL
jgi:hypothetical protein